MTERGEPRVLTLGDNLASPHLPPLSSSSLLPHRVRTTPVPGSRQRRVWRTRAPRSRGSREIARHPGGHAQNTPPRPFSPFPRRFSREFRAECPDNAPWPLSHKRFPAKTPQEAAPVDPWPRPIFAKFGKMRSCLRVFASFSAYLPIFTPTSTSMQRYAILCSVFTRKTERISRWREKWSVCVRS